MAEHPLKKLARLLGGVALSQGRVPHQLLGQLLVSNSSSVELAGANVVVAAGMRQPNAVAQVAVRTAAPALAVNSIVQREERRLKRRLYQVECQEKKAGTALLQLRQERHDNDVCIKRLLELQRSIAAGETRSEHSTADHAALDERAALLDARNAQLEEQVTAVRAREAELETRTWQLEQASVSLETKATALDLREAELSELATELERSQARLDQDEQELHQRRLALLSEAAEGRAQLERELESLREELDALRSTLPGAEPIVDPAPEADPTTTEPTAAEEPSPSADTRSGRRRGRGSKKKSKSSSRSKKKSSRRGGDDSGS